MPPVIGRFSSAKTHSDCLNIIFQYAGGKKAVSDTVSDLIIKYVYEGYERDGGVHPKVICDGCRKTLSDIHNNPDDSQRHLPPTPPYHLLVEVVGCVTRSKAVDNCLCELGKIGMMKCQEYLNYEKLHCNKKGRRTFTPASPPPQKLPLCSKCFGIVKRGVSHTCNEIKKSKNLVDHVRTSDDKTQGKVTSEVLKGLCSNDGASTSRDTLILPTGGKSLQVTLGKPKVSVKKPKFSSDSLKRLQTACNFSNRQTL